MATQAFEDFKKQQKAQSASTPSAAAPATPGETDAFKAFKDSLKPKPAAPKQEAVASAAPAAKPDPSLLTKPKSSESFLAPSPALPTYVQATQANDELYKPVIDQARAVTNIVQTFARKARKSDNTGLAVVGGVTDEAINTAKDLLRKGRAMEQAQTKAGAAATGLDLAINLGTLGITDFATGAAPEVFRAAVEGLLTPTLGTDIAKKAGQVTQKGTQVGLNLIFNNLLYEGLGGIAAQKYQEVTGTTLTPEEQHAVKSAVTGGLMIAGFKGAQTAGKVKANYGNFKSAIEAEFVAPAYDTLGISPNRALTPETLQAKYKDALTRAAEVTTPDKDVRMNAIDQAYQIARDYQQMNAFSFARKWGDQYAVAKGVADEISQRAEKVKQGIDTFTKAETVEAAISSPDPKVSRKALKRVQSEPDLQLAFESELVDMNAELDPKLSKNAATDGYAYSRVNDPMSDTPARFDIQDGRTQIVFNDAVIQKQLARMMDGDVLIVGEGRNRRVFRRGANESFEALKTRFETELLQHEMSHLKTVSPEDVAALRAARVAGDDATAEKIRRSLEEKANTYMFEKSGELAEEARSVIEQADAFRIARENYKETTKSLVFADEVKEAEYKRFRAKAKQGPVAEAPKEFESRFRAEEAARREYTQVKERYVESSRKLKADERRVVEREVARPVVRLREGEDGVKVARRTSTEQRLFKERLSRRLEVGVVKERLNAKIEEVKAKFKDREAVKQSIVDYLRENKVPKDVRTKFVNKIQSAKTPEDAARIIREINAGWDRKTRTDLMKKTVELLDRTKAERNASGVRTSKYTQEVQSKLDRIRAYSKMDATQVGRQMAEMIDKFYANVQGDKSVALPDDLALELDLMEMGMLRTKSSRRLRNNIAAIEELIQTGKTERQRQRILREKTRDALVNDAVSAVLGGEEYVAKIQPGLDQKPISSFLNKAAADITPGISLFEGLGQKARKLADDVNSAILAGQNSTIKFGKSIQERLNKIYGSEADWHRASRELSKPYDFGTFTNKRGEKQSLKMSRYRAIEIYLANKDPHKSRYLKSAEGNAFTDEMVSAVELRLSNKDKQLGDLIMEGYKELGSKLAPAVGKETGVNMNLVENYTGQLRRDASPDVETSFVQAMLSDHFDRLSARPEFTKSRGSDTSPLKFSDNPLIDLFTYARKANHYISVADVARKMDGLIGNSKFRNAVIDARGREFYDALSFANENVKRGASPPREMSNAGKFMYKVQNNIITSLLMSPKVVAGQFASVASFRAAVATSKAKGSFWKGVMNTRKNLALMKEYTPSLVARYEDMPADQVRKIAEDRSALSRGIDYIAEKFSIPLNIADKITTLSGASGLWEVKVKEFMDAGKSLEESRRLAGRFIDSTITSSQSTRSLLGKSKLELSSDVMQAFTVLQNQPNKLALANALAVKKLRRGELTVKQFTDFVVWNSVIQPALYTSIRAAVGAGLAAALPQDKKKQEEEQPSLAQNIVAGAVEQNTGFMLVGQLVRTLMANFAGKNYELRPSVLQVLFDGIIDASRQAGSGDYDEAALISAREVLRTLKLGAVVPLLEAYRKALAEQNNERRAAERKKNPKTKKTK